MPFLSLLLSFSSLSMAAPTADEILAQIDQNMNYDTRTAQLQMTVTKGRRVKIFEMTSHGRGADEAAIEFKAPARDKGTKMLKKGDELWMYLPSIEQTQRISGHMLRQGMMGSDMSYEDILESSALKDIYTATVVGEETILERPVYRLELIAKSNEVAYAKRVSWIDSEFLVPVKEELYATSGMLVKEWTMTDVIDIEGRKFPTRIVVEDKLQANSKTEMQFISVDFKVDVEDEVFSQRWLER
ncbi:MAG: outer membrane lipoprotein-sorting protein [Myxococcota bacterium]|nr:outer membrane lipoprotein-sorting protein [Myxococcota bacterium]